MRGAIYVSDSKNNKISGKNKVDATYSSIKATCDSSCPFQKDKSCYAKQSFVGMIVKRLDSQARQFSALELARAEAKCIDAAYNGKAIPKNRDLRIHVSGDARVQKAARMINSAVKRWKKRGGRDAWSYSHSWKNVHRSFWKDVSILASIESVSQVDAARKMGYAPALVVSEFKSNKAFKIHGCSTTFIPCPAQTNPNGKEVNCVSCRLCMKADWLYETNRGISFSAHGVKRNEIKRRLFIIQ